MVYPYPSGPLHTPEYSALARYFDLLSEKYVPYAGQCAFLEAALGRYRAPGRRLLDLASGTGLHAFPLAQRGYQVTGVDRSPEMLAEARRKLAGLPGGQAPAFLLDDIRQLPFRGAFDAAFAFNYPVAYCLDHASLAALFAGASRALRPGGLFLFDFFSHYNLSASSQHEEAETGEVHIEIAKEFSYDHLRQVLHERDLYTLIDKRDGSTRTLVGYDAFRVFYPQELAYYLETLPKTIPGRASAPGFRLLAFHKRWDLDAEPNRSDLVAVAQKAED